MSLITFYSYFSAKVLVPGEPNVAYICSRYYRAPELIFGATDYTVNIGMFYCIFFMCSNTVFIGFIC